MEVWHVRFCCIRCPEGTLWMEWPILHGSRCLVGSIHWDFSGKHPFHFLDFPRMLGNIMSLSCRLPQETAQLGEQHTKFLSPLSTVVLVEPRQTCHLTTLKEDSLKGALLGFVAAFASSALKVYGQIGHWSGTQWGEVKKVLCRCPDVLFTLQFTCNRIRSWVALPIRHAIYASKLQWHRMLSLPIHRSCMVMLISNDYV